MLNTLMLSAKLLVTPHQGWQAIAATNLTLWRCLAWHTLPLALLPAVAWYVGVTLSGWEILDETRRLTAASALPMCVLFYLAMVAGVLFLGYMVVWMAENYTDTPTQALHDGPASTLAPAGSVTLAQAVTLISFTATPFFAAGVLGFWPNLWVDIIAGVGVSCYCIYLLYAGIPAMLKVTPERGFLYASAVFAVALVSFVGLLTATVLIWDFGPAPEYAY